jgi:GntP family gluconate:H+ symporter
MWLLLLLLGSVAFIVLATATLRLHPVFALLGAAFGYGMLSGTMSLDEVVQSVNTGFGGTIGAIGIVIVAGSVIGTFLEKSGGAFTLAEGLLRIVGPKRVPLAMSALGYVVSIPVFCDTGFVILISLAKALARKAGISLAVAAMALSLGLLVTHSLVPPTPGPLAAAGLLGADLGLVMLLALPVSLAGLAAGWLFSITAAGRVYINPGSGSLPDRAAQPDAPAPSALKSLVPLLLPILLIILGSLHRLGALRLDERAGAAIAFVGQPVVALLIGVLTSFLLPFRLTRDMLSSAGWVGEAIAAATAIILITGCGGAFGRVLQDSGLAGMIGDNLSGARSLGVALPMLIAMALKSAQGSGTVAIITTASLMAPLLTPLGLDSLMARALLVVAIGSGSMIASHVNDSYFWVVTQFSGMTVTDGYRLQTGGTAVIGLVSAVAAWLLSLVVL